MSGDSKRLFTAAEDGTFAMWDSKTGDKLWECGEAWAKDGGYATHKQKHVGPMMGRGCLCRLEGGWGCGTGRLGTSYGRESQTATCTSGAWRGLETTRRSRLAVAVTTAGSCC
ncbi:unnamed protein product [Chondrus crispus]|uniref:Uncharacterized protein n=1 Tax=Chondrus crispus TaxID=2769 RepID=R7QJW3_CHOCR|nr:unnamed protein product [Chondrus crispus]CDF37705.1 unnamed protein product [Chondrus crispus]|eukprot:XP_005717576.1 unnamed protein product [Chondrus crispus]